MFTSLKNAIKKNPTLYYSLKMLKRKVYERRMEKMSMDEVMAYDADLYLKAHGRPLDWDHLKSYTEKMQWEKLFDRNPLKTVLTDKYEVRSWVGDKIGEEYLIPLLGVWNRASEIDFARLPDKFVLKTNCGSGDVVIVRDKSKLSQKDIQSIKAKIGYYLAIKFGYGSCEFHYNSIKPKVIAETLIESVGGGGDLQDYKFLCFGGEAHFCWVDLGRYHKHTRNVYDLNWNLQDWNQGPYEISESDIPRPKNFEKMIVLAEILAKGFSHVRVDLYNVDGRIYFGEMTFTNASGFERIVPISADNMLGELWEIDTSVRK